MDALRQILAKIHKPEKLFGLLNQPLPHPAEAYKTPSPKVEVFPLTPKSKEEGLEIVQHLVAGSDENEMRFELIAYLVSPQKTLYIGTFDPAKLKKELSSSLKKAQELSAFTSI